MANIRFVKPPPDNRIRDFPHTLGQAQNECQITTGLEPAPTLHITTPKRRKDHLPRWDIFITSRRTIDLIENSTSSSLTTADLDQIETVQQAKQTHHRQQNTVDKQQDSLQETQSLEEDNSKIDTNCNVEPAYPTKHASKTVSIDTVELQAIKTAVTKSIKSDFDVKAKKTDGTWSTDNTETVLNEVKGPSNVDNTSFPSKGWVGEQNQPVDHTKANATKTTHNHLSSKQCTVAGRQYIGLSDVSEDEVASLPEVRGPTACVTPTDGRLQGQNHQDPQRNIEKHSQNEMPFICNTHETNVTSQKSQSNQVARNNSKLSLIGLPRRPFPIGPLRRSISEYDFSYENPYDDDDEEDISFFSRVKTSNHSKPKRPNLQDTRADSLDKSTHHKIHKMGPTHFPKYAWSERTVLNTEIFGGSDLALPSKGAFLLKEDRSCNSLQERSAGFGNFSGPSTPVDHFIMTDQPHSDTYRGRLYSARLTMRRFALADPERMIMSQELREKLEKDVQKRKSSKVRKVSQFFNIQLGLNKEEDLI